MERNEKNVCFDFCSFERPHGIPDQVGKAVVVAAASEGAWWGRRRGWRSKYDAFCDVQTEKKKHHTNLNRLDLCKFVKCTPM
jgi:hypothetical protein